MIKLRNKNIIIKGSIKYLTVMEGFIPFTIAPNVCLPYQKGKRNSSLPDGYPRKSKGPIPKYRNRKRGVYVKNRIEK